MVYQCALYSKHCNRNMISNAFHCIKMNENRNEIIRSEEIKKKWSIFSILFCYLSTLFKNKKFSTIRMNETYNISSSANPLKACSSRHVISLLSICRLRNDVAPLKIFRPIVVSKLCDRSLCEWHRRFFCLVQTFAWICRKKERTQM